MGKKNKKSQDKEDVCAILELKKGYYSISVGSKDSRVFYYKLQGMQLVIEFFDSKRIATETMFRLISFIKELDNPFMFHPKERSSKQREVIEEVENTQILFTLQVRTEKMPQVALVSTKSENINAYILGLDFKSENFSTLEDGINEAHKMVSELKLCLHELSEVVRQINDLFPDSIYFGEQYKTELN